MPVQGHTRTRRRLSPCLVTLLNEMTIPPFKNHDLVSSDPSFGLVARVGATPSLIDVPILVDDADFCSSQKLMKRRCQTRVRSLAREECSDHPLVCHGSFGGEYDHSFSSLRGRVQSMSKTQDKFRSLNLKKITEKSSNQAYYASTQEVENFEVLRSLSNWFKETFSVPNYALGARESHNPLIWGELQAKEPIGIIPSPEEDNVLEPCVTKQLQVFRVSETPLRNSRPRLARENGDFLRIYALENSMRLSGKLREPSAPMFLEPKRLRQDETEIFGISTKIGSGRTRRWCDLSVAE